MIRAFILLLLTSSNLFGGDLDASVASAMHNRDGAAVVVEVATGKIVGAYHIDVAGRRLARPGSAFKPFTLLALLENGKLKSTEAFTCRRNLRVGRHNLSCSHPQTAQPLQAVSALAYSCNDFFATIGGRLTAEELRSVFQRSGFASPSGLAKSEAVGSIALASADEERELQAIGEGEMKVTPLEMLAAYRNLALRRNDPHSSDAERTVFAGLEAGTDYGMARLAAVKEMKVAGKTGTARSDSGSWTNGWFAGFAPAEHPQIAVVVFLEHGTGPGDAAPIAAEIFGAWRARR